MNTTSNQTTSNNPDSPTQSTPPPTPPHPTATPPTPSPSAQDTKTEAEKHYEALISLHKYAITLATAIIGIIATVTGVALSYITYKDGQALRTHYNELKTSTTNEVKEMRSAAEDKIKASEHKIREEAAAAASNAAKKGVDEAINTPQITEIIKATIKKAAGAQIDHTMGEIREELAVSNQIQSAASRMRQNLRGGLERLTSLQTDADTESNREMAKELLEMIISDFEERLPEPTTIEGEKMDPEAINSLMSTIRKKKGDLMVIAQSFQELRERTGITFKLFDFKAAEQWCKKNAHVCNPK